MDDDTTQAQQDFCSLMEQMTGSVSATRTVIQSLLQKRTSESGELSTKDGISLLSLKHHVMLTYLQSLILLSSRRVLKHSLAERAPPTKSFSDPQRDERGAGAGDLVDNMIEGRVVLEKIKALEGRMKYQIEKLVRLSEEQKVAVDDPLAFRPNPANLMDGDMSATDEEQEDEKVADDVYRPPRLAPVPYTETSAKEKRARRQAEPQALRNMVYHDPSMPHAESTSGLGSMPSLQSKRAREIQEMKDFEEANFTRLVMNKKEAKRRARDEADIALGGGGGASGRRGRGAGGLEDEFGDVLRSVERGSGGKDGYEELRLRGKKSGVLDRSRVPRVRDEEGDPGAEGPKRKKTRFDDSRKRMKKKLKK